MSVLTEFSFPALATSILEELAHLVLTLVSLGCHLQVIVIGDVIVGDVVIGLRYWVPSFQFLFPVFIFEGPIGDLCVRKIVLNTCSWKASQEKKNIPRATSEVLLNIDHTLTEWPNIDRFLFFQLFLLLLKKIFANSIERKTPGILQSIVI